MTSAVARVATLANFPLDIGIIDLSIAPKNGLAARLKPEISRTPEA